MAAMAQLEVCTIEEGIDASWVFMWLESHDGDWQEAFLYLEDDGVCSCCGVSMAGEVL